MRCDEMRGLLDLYMDGELPEETVAKMDRHLMRCADCAYDIRTLEQTVEMLRAAIPPAETSPAFRERAAARLLDALSPHLRPAPETESARQWKLPFA